MPSLGAAATISGEGVSPAASAAAIGSPPGSAAATCNAEDGTLRRIFLQYNDQLPFRSAGSRSLTIEVGVVGVVSLRRSLINSPSVGASNARLPVKSS